VPLLAQGATHVRLASPLGRTIYEAALPCSVAAAAEALFSAGSSFIPTLCRRQGGAAGRDEVRVEAWRCDGGGLVRGVRWATDVRSKLSPVQRTRVVEEQSCATLEGGDVVLEARQAFPDLPKSLGPQFLVRTQWRLSAADAASATGEASRAGCGLAITQELEWLSSSWLSKMVEKTTFEESTEAFGRLLPPLLQEILGATQAPSR
jgi:hypothetical protein